MIVLDRSTDLLCLKPGRKTAVPNQSSDTGRASPLPGSATRHVAVLDRSSILLSANPDQESAAPDQLSGNDRAGSLRSSDLLYMHLDHESAPPNESFNSAVHAGLLPQRSVGDEEPSRTFGDGDMDQEKGSDQTSSSASCSRKPSLGPCLAKTPQQETLPQVSCSIDVGPIDPYQAMGTSTMDLVYRPGSPSRRTTPFSLLPIPSSSTETQWSAIYRHAAVST